MIWTPKWLILKVFAMIDELIYVVFPIRCLNIYAGTVIRLHFAIIGTII